MKYCPRCKTTKDLGSFYKNRSQHDGLTTYCKPCHNENTKLSITKMYRNKNSTQYKKMLLNCRKSYKKHRNQRLKKMAEERAKLTPEERKARSEASVAWSKANKKKNRAKSNAYRLRKIQATPKWLTPQQLMQIRAFSFKAKELTKATGVRHETDHIIPLGGENVCGLHVPWNIQVVTSTYNKKKRNSLIK